MKLFRFVAIAGAVALIGCADMPGKESAIAARGHSEHAKIDYAKYTKNTVNSFPVLRLDDWDSPDIGHVVVWTGRSDAYMLLLSGACLALNSSFAIGVTSHGSSVHAGIDYVIVDNERCRIESIQRLDGAAIKADLKADLKAAEKASVSAKGEHKP